MSKKSLAGTWIVEKYEEKVVHAEGTTEEGDFSEEVDPSYAYIFYSDGTGFERFTENEFYRLRYTAGNNRLTVTYVDSEGASEEGALEFVVKDLTESKMVLATSESEAGETFTATATVSGTCGFTSIVVNYVYTGVVVTKYDITIDSGIANDTVSADMNKAAEGATVTLTATPASGYALDAWNVYKTGDSGTKVTVTSNSFTMPAYAVTVSASFAAVPTITMNTTSIVDVAAAGVSATAAGAYNLVNGASNSDVTITCDGTVVTAAGKNATAGSIDYTVAANSSSARSGWIKVKYGTEDPHEISVSQLAGVSGPSNGDVLFSTDFGSSAVALASFTGGSSYNDASTITYTASNASYVKN